MSLLYSNRRESLPGSRRFWQSTLFPRKYRRQGSDTFTIANDFIDTIDNFHSNRRLLIFLLFQFQNIPPDLSQCVFVIEQALSVRALQELVTAAGSETVTFIVFFFFILRIKRTTRSLILL